LCYSIKKQQNSVPLSDKKAIDLALTTEVPINKPISLFELAVIVWSIQSRPWYDSALVSIYKIKEFLDELILQEPRKIIELEKDNYLIRFV